MAEIAEEMYRMILRILPENIYMSEMIKSYSAEELEIEIN